MEFDIEKLERCINSLGEKFIKWPYNFFTEADAQAFLYYFVSRSGDRSLKVLYPTKDKRFKTVLLHREYPTIFKFKKKEMEISPEGMRGHYDLAILNPKFVESHSMATVIAKTFGKAAKEDRDHLIAAIEFKFIYRPTSKDLSKEIEKDAKKLNWSVTLEPPQSKNAYLLVFNRYGHEPELINDLKGWSKKCPQVKMLYIESIAAEKHKKVIFRGDWQWQAPLLLKNQQQPD